MTFFRSFLLLMVMMGVSLADEIRPAYLEIQSSDGKIFHVKWKVPMKNNMALGIKPLIPQSCKSTPHSFQDVGGAAIENWSMMCPDGLVGKEISIEGLESTATDVLARVILFENTAQMYRLTPTKRSFTIEAKQSAWEVTKTYTIIGIEHILMGIDHLLFVFALLLLVNGWKRLIGTITAFTLAHSMTLAAATLGWVSVPQSPVEAVIALSILFLAVEIIHSRQGKISLAEQYPWLIAFIFGLLHGFGFAGALKEVGLPEESIPLALLFFNVGVELGQLIFVAVVLFLGWVLKRVLAQNLLDKGQTIITYIIGGLASFWVIERTYSYWS